MPSYSTVTGQDQAAREAMIWQLRAKAADSIGLGDLVPTGSPAEYSALDAEQQVALSDQMARYIVTNPIHFSDQEIEIAQNRVDSVDFGQPLDDAGYWSNLMDAVADGSFYDAATGGGKEYLKTIALYGVGAAVLLIIINAQFNARRK